MDKSFGLPAVIDACTALFAAIVVTKVPALMFDAVGVSVALATVGGKLITFDVSSTSVIITLSITDPCRGDSGCKSVAEVIIADNILVAAGIFLMP